MRSHEMIYLFSKAGSYYNRVDIKGEFKEHRQFGKPKTDSTYSLLREKTITRPVGTITSTADKRCVKSVIQINSTMNKNRHPTEKPMELYKWLIERYCPPGGTLLDPTAGSCNSCFAGFELDRNCIGIEKDPGFYKTACDRVDALYAS